jgi:hypothetical protein
MSETTNIPTTQITSRIKRTPSHRQVHAGGQGLLNLINLVLIVLTIRDIRHRSDEELNGKRKLWMLVAFVSPIGPIAYFVYMRRNRAQTTEVPFEPVETA